MVSARDLMHPAERSGDRIRRRLAAQTAEGGGERNRTSRHRRDRDKLGPMSGHVHAVLEQAKRLTADERIELARELLASVDEDEEAGTPEEIEAAWDDEIRRRDEQVLVGGGGAHDAEGVLAEAERIIRAKR
jgi:putative addiction module component (TIGR02574 family)